MELTIARNSCVNIDFDTMLSFWSPDIFIVWFFCISVFIWIWLWVSGGYSLVFSEVLLAC
jgi:hypothetical protein